MTAPHGVYPANGEYTPNGKPHHTHTHARIQTSNSDTCLRILTRTPTQARRHTLGRHTQPIKRALFSHLMILKMLVFHWLKHSKQTWRGDPTNNQPQVQVPHQQ